MWFSFSKYSLSGRAKLTRKALHRAALLFGVGLLLAWYPFWGKSLSELRVLGVLQRIGLCYGLAALLVLYLPLRGQVAAAICLLIGYWVALAWSVPSSADPFSLEDNLVRRVDLALLGASHLWKGKGIPFDPEGLLSTLPAVVTVLLGWWAGQQMQRLRASPLRAVYTLGSIGLLLAVLGGVWHLLFPINKSLWTSSFVLYTGGLSMLLLALSIGLIDIMRLQGLAYPFIVLGANPLFAYVLSGVLVKTLLHFRWAEGEEQVNAYRWLYQSVFALIKPNELSSLLFALTFALICWIVCWQLHRRNIYVKI